MTDYAKLSDRELDARAGLLAGTMKIAAANSHKDTNQPFCIVAIAPAYGMRGIVPDRPNVEHRYIVPEITPRYSADLNAARELEDVIERSDRCDAWYQYVGALMRVCRPDGGWRLLSQERIGWICARATAKQRALAFCELMEGR